MDRDDTDQVERNGEKPSDSGHIDLDSLLRAERLQKPLNESHHQHLAGCQFCQLTVDMLAVSGLETRLSHPVHREHLGDISELELGEWAAGMLSAERARAVESLVECCPVCRSLAAEARAELELLGQVEVRLAEGAAEAADLRGQEETRLAEDSRPATTPETGTADRTGYEELKPETVGEAGAASRSEVFSPSIQQDYDAQRRTPLAPGSTAEKEECPHHRWWRVPVRGLKGRPMYASAWGLAVAAVLVVVFLPWRDWWQSGALSSIAGFEDGFWHFPGVKGGGTPLQLSLRAEVYVSTEQGRWRKIDQLEPSASRPGSCPIGARIKLTARVHGRGYLSLWRVVEGHSELLYASKRERFPGIERVVPPSPDGQDISTDASTWILVERPSGEQRFVTVLSREDPEELPDIGRIESVPADSDGALVVQGVRCLAGER